MIKFINLKKENPYLELYLRELEGKKQKHNHIEYFVHTPRFIVQKSDIGLKHDQACSSHFEDIFFLVWFE